MAGPPDSHLVRSGLLALACSLGALLSGGVQAEAPALQDLIDRYLEEKQRDDSRRSQTLREIGDVNTARAVAFLVAEFEAVEKVQQTWVVSGLARARIPQAFKALAGIATSGGAYISARMQAVTGLTGFEKPDPIPLLFELADDANASVASSAVRGLDSVIGRQDADPRARRSVLKRFRTFVTEGKSGSARGAAITALDARLSKGEDIGLDPGQWTRQMRSLVTSESDPTALAAAVEALGRSHDPRDFMRVMELTDHQHYSVKRAALRVLAGFEVAPEKKEDVFLAATRDPSPMVREVGFQGLVGSRRKSVIEAARQALFEDVYPRAREQAAAVLAASQQPGVELTLLRALAELLEPAPEEQPRSYPESYWTSLQAALTKALGAVLDEERIPEFAGKVRHARSAWIRIASLQALGATGHPAADEAILETLQDRDPRVAAAAIEAAARGRIPGALARLLELTPKLAGNKGCLLALLDAMGTLAKEADSQERGEVAGVLDGYLVSRDPEVAMVAMDAGGRAGLPELVDTIHTILENPAWQRRSAAIAALARIRVKASILPLIARLDQETRKLQLEVIAALYRITGKQIGDDPALWLAWWEVVQEDFVVPSLAELEGGGGLTVVGGSYYGIPIVSDRLIFILDISGSMSSSATGPGEGATRLERAKTELIKAIGDLGRGVRFNVIFFDHQIRTWEERLTLATRQSRVRATKKVRRQSPQGGTNIFDAVAKAFEDRNVDTIYLLTDGQPGAGKYVNPRDIRREIEKMNRTRRITIHTIALGSTNQLLKDLAADSNGKYVER